jgi:helicase
MTNNTRVNQVTGTPAIDLALDTLQLGKQAIVFAGSKRSAEKTAEDIAKKIKVGVQEQDSLHHISEQCRKALASPTKQCERLAYCLQKGTAFHHAGLVEKQRTLIEDSFKQGIVKIICSTPTLAYGVDIPSYRTILKDLKRYNPPRGMSWIPVLDYEQMAGRSGRPKYEKVGEAIAVATSEKDQENITEKYLYGEPEEILSKLAVEPVLRTYTLSLIATGFVKTKKELMEFFSRTFWAHQYEDMERLEEIMDKMLNLLEEYQFITTPSSGEFRSAKEQDDEILKATTLGQRVAQLYLDPLTAYSMIQCMQEAQQKETTAFSFLHMLTSQLEIRPLLRVKTKEWEEVQASLVDNEENLLLPEPDVYDPDYDEYLASIKTAQFLQEWVEEKGEEHLLEKYAIRPGEIRGKLGIADWLVYSAAELAKLMKLQPLVKDLLKVKFRLKYGVKEELLSLLKLEGIGRVRARKLFKQGIKDLGGVKRAEITTLVQVVGKANAIKVKQQVGEEHNPDKIQVKENKRKGQISLMDY